ncbi:integrase family protein [Stenotrophomonas maltophilia]|uniref:integrase family protein n=1 Tax=Stenotrophomonas maltophilia TaxID=40324 RepID=UPI0019D4BF91|nr:integrase family protein [Stenotrophomonas maltophilia]MBN7830646.1 integrase family protein [Stenotrophomonas maltophilia]MBN7834873.1 integrase family protein [Stenotrophomonas maltophilia]MBN7858773.1 integrase family protein [Stenotrophomonas maltophilia]MBN7918223.1 integrase family protein [Stenotrophomonas maltophilia]MBO2883140.1 integrase family protein [Stenotrophomonas maltophilia]
MTRKTVDAAKATGKAYRLRDATVPGLVLRVSAVGAKSWAIVWGRGQERAFANYPATTLEGAREAARRLSAEIDQHGAPAAVVTPKSELTVADACRDYVTSLEKDGRKTASDDAKRRFERCLYGDKLAKVRLKDLHQDHIEAWRDRVEKGDLPPLPVKRGRPPVAKPLARSSINRIRTTLVAALNHAVTRRKVSPDLAFEWNAVKPLKDAGQRRGLYLEREQRRALLEAAEGPVRELIECVALTGCRPGDPSLCLRSDYDGRTASVRFRSKDHDRKIPLSPAATALFDRLAKGKLPKAHLFTQDGKKVWTPTDWSELVRDAAARAGLPAGVTLYTLRHCWITDAIVGGMDLLTVAKLAGTSLAMIEKHYGHLVQGAARDKLAQVQFL